MTFVITKTLYVIPALCDECLVVVLNLMPIHCEFPHIRLGRISQHAGR